MPENDLKLPSRSYWDGFKARNAALLDKIAYSGNIFTEATGLASMLRYITGDPNTTSTEAIVAPVAGTSNVVSKGVQKAAPVVKEAAEQAVEQVVKRRGRPPKAAKAAETQLKPRVQKAVDEIETMAKEKVDRIKTAYSNRKYRKSDKKVKGVDIDQQSPGYNTVGKDNIADKKDFWGNPAGTSYHPIEDYDLKYPWNPKKGALGNFNDLKKFIKTHHPDIEYYHDESVWKYLMKNHPEQMKAAGYNLYYRYGGLLKYINNKYV